MDASSIWARIVAAAGQRFQTTTGKPFTYRVSGSVLRPSRTNRNLHQSQFERAWALRPLRNVAQLQWQVQGPSYIFAILTDPRICEDSSKEL